MAVPVAIMLASMHTSSPRLCDRDVSATQEGMVEVFMPVREALARPKLSLLKNARLTVSDTSDNTADDELGASIVSLDCGDLNNNSNDHDALREGSARACIVSRRKMLTSSQLNHLATTETVPHHEGKDGPKETSKLVNGSAREGCQHEA